MKLQLKGKLKQFADIEISGAKNNILPLVCAAILYKRSAFENVPHITDLDKLLTILSMDLPFQYSRLSDILVIDRIKKINNTIVLTNENIGLIRYSTLLMGALLGAGVRQISIPSSGGCSSFGARPIDIHLDGFSALGYEINLSGGRIEIRRETEIVTKVTHKLRFASVGATMNLVMAGLGRKGETTLTNIAKEPEVVNFIKYLAKRSGRIYFENDYIVIKEISKSHGHDINNNTIWRAIPDRIETVSYIVLGALSEEGCRLRNIKDVDLKGVSDVLKQMGIKYHRKLDEICVFPSRHNLISVNIKTGVFPTLNTDYHPLVVMGLIFASGKSEIIETVYPDRFKYIHEIEKVTNLKYKMRNKGSITIYGNPHLVISEGMVQCHDLRAGFCMFILGSVSTNALIIDNADQVLRGYSNLLDNFSKFGISISRI